MALLGRAVAATLAAAALIACYQPTLRDCTVSCTSASDCAGDQVCGAGGWCAAPGVACSLEPDAASPDGDTTDASDPDAHIEIDASSADATATDAAADVAIDAGATLRVVITGRGSVAGDYPGVSCMGPQGDCSFGIPPGTSVMLTAVDGPGGHMFVDWTTPNCMGMGRTCALTVTAPVTLVGVTFD